MRDGRRARRDARTALSMHGRSSKSSEAVWKYSSAMAKLFARLRIQPVGGRHLQDHPWAEPGCRGCRAHGEAPLRSAGRDPPEAAETRGRRLRRALYSVHPSLVPLSLCPSSTCAYRWQMLQGRSPPMLFTLRAMMHVGKTAIRSDFESASRPELNDDLFISTRDAGQGQVGSLVSCY